ncbi:MAG: alpha/beta fold hydrolase [Candidatus Krumholzibacteriia bacterium]
MLVNWRRYANSLICQILAFYLLMVAVLSGGCSGGNDPMSPSPGNSQDYLISARPDTIVHEDSQVMVIIPADMFEDGSPTTIATSVAPELTALPPGVSALTQAVRFSADLGSLQDQPDSVRVAKAVIVTLPALPGVKVARESVPEEYARVAVEIPGWGTMMVYGSAKPTEGNPGGFIVEIPELFFGLFASEVGHLKWETQIVCAAAHLDVQPKLFHVLGMSGGNPSISEVNGRIDVPAGKGLVVLIHGWSMDESAQFDGQRAAERVAGYWREAIAYFHGQASRELDMYCLFYDEDLDLETIGAQLQEKAAQWFDPTVHSKAIVVAHSMGGLVTRTWMNNNQGTQVVKKAILLDTPHHGSVLANIFLGLRALVPLFLPPTGAQNLVFDTGIDLPWLQWRTNPFLANLNEDESHWQEYFLVGGIDVPDHWPTIATQKLFLLCHGAISDPRFAGQSDGVVELGSQLPDDLHHDVNEKRHGRYHDDAKSDPALLAYCLQKIRENINPFPDPVGQFLRIPAGTFIMGSPLGELGRYSDEVQHQVTLTRPFWLATTEVTEELWDSVMGSGTSTSQLPKVYVEWDEAVAFCNQLSLREGLAPAYTQSGTRWVWNQSTNGFRLPTEAEWEFACRSGSSTAFANGGITEVGCDNDPNLNAMGWYCGNSDNQRHVVGQKAANPWGLFDMHGNVWEWCWDWYGSYSTLAVTDPVGPDSGSYHVLRGGSFGAGARDCRSAAHGLNYPVSSDFGIRGFRLSRSAF